MAAQVSTQIAAADELLESIKVSCRTAVMRHLLPARRPSCAYSLGNGCLQDVMKTDVQPDPRIAMYDKAISLYNDARHLVHTTYITNDSSIAEVRVGP